MKTQMNKLLTLTLSLFCIFQFSAVQVHAQIPKLKKPKVKVPKIGKKSSKDVKEAINPAASEIKNFETQAEKLQYCVDNKVWADQNSNGYKSILGRAESALEKIKEKAPKKAPKYQTQYDEYFAIWDKHLDEEAEAKGIRRKKADISASPAAATIKKFRSALSFAKSDVERKYSGAAGRVEECEKLLAQIKKEDPNWVEYEIDEADFMDVKNLFEKNKFTAESRSTFERYSSPVSMLEREPWQYKRYAETMEFSKFEAAKKAYMGQDNQDEYVLKLINKTDKFFKESRPKVLEHCLKDAKETLESTNFMNKAARTKSDFLERFSLNWKPQSPIKKLDNAIGACDKGLLFDAENADIKAIRKQLETQKEDISAYETSGQFEKDIATKKQMIIDAERLEKALTTNAALNTVLKRDISTDRYGSVLRINITSRDWIVHKNDFDLPTEKVMYVDCATKKDGKCYRVTGKFIKTYEGGGVYGKPYYRSSNRWEMNCANVNK